MALLNEVAPDGPTLFTPIPVREHLRTIAWLRWRLFVNGLRKSGGELSFLVKFITIPMQAIFVLMVFSGCAAAAYFSIDRGHPHWLTGLLWGIAVFSQFLPIFTAAAAPPFDFASLIRFPFSYRGYLALRVFYGLLDSHAIIANFAVLGVFLGMLFAGPSLALRAIPALLLFALVNFFFTRMVLAWIDRWLARRKTREILSVFAILLSLSFQLAAQAPRYIRHARLSAADHPVLLRTWDILTRIAAVLPPSIASSSIAHTAHSSSLAALANDAVLAVFAAAFALLLHLRLFAEYRGENLSEAPARKPIKLKPANAAAPTATPATLQPAAVSATGTHTLGINRIVLAVVDKEIRLLLRGSAKIQQLASPLMMAAILVLRTHTMGGPRPYTWPMVCGYTLFFLTAMLNNSLGAEGAGLNFYFLAPVRIRDIILGKNIVTFGIYVIELSLVYGIVFLFGAAPPAHNMIFTLEWTAFALVVSFSVGNLLSLYWPRKYEVGKVRRQNVSGAASFISIAVLLGLILIGFGVHFLAMYLERPYLPAAIFATLTVIAAAAYILTLNRLDHIADTRKEQISAEVCKP